MKREDRAQEGARGRYSVCPQSASGSCLHRGSWTGALFYSWLPPVCSSLVPASGALGICTEGSPKLHDYLSLAPQCEPLSQAWNVLLHDTHPLAVSCPVPLSTGLPDADPATRRRALEVTESKGFDSRKGELSLRREKLGESRRPDLLEERGLFVSGLGSAFPIEENTQERWRNVSELFQSSVFIERLLRARQYWSLWTVDRLLSAPKTGGDRHRRVKRQDRIGGGGQRNLPEEKPPPRCSGSGNLGGRNPKMWAAGARPPREAPSGPGSGRSQITTKGAGGRAWRRPPSGKGVGPGRGLPSDSR